MSDYIGSSSLKDLVYKDIYIRVDDAATVDTQSRYNPRPGPDYNGYSNHPVPIEYGEDINLLRLMLKKSEKDDFAVSYDGERMRVARFWTEGLNGKEQWTSLRRFPKSLPKLENLKFRQDILDAFRSFCRRTGIIVVGGATGAGKTTTGVGLVRECMVTLGGLTYTVEDPVEYSMQGPFSENPDNAFVLQREVDKDEDWAPAIATALRSAPKFIFLGEIRTPAAARQALRAANSGHLVICTVHGGSVEQTISAVVQIAERELGPLAPVLLADGLCAVAHQELINGVPNVTLIQTSPEMSCPVRQNVRQGKLHMLSTSISQQAASRQRQVDSRENRAVGKEAGPNAAAHSRSPKSQPRVKQAPPPKKGLSKFFGG